MRIRGKIETVHLHGRPWTTVIEEIGTQGHAQALPNPHRLREGARLVQRSCFLLTYRRLAYRDMERILLQDQGLNLC